MNAILSLVAVLAATALLVWCTWDGLIYLAGQWAKREEYSHGSMIPFLAVYLMLLKKEKLLPLTWKGSLLSVLVLVGGFFLITLGELSSIYEIIQYGFLVSLAGLFVAFWGVRPSVVIWTALFYLVFMIPLPAFLHIKLSSGLQLISSELGVAFLRAIGVSVYLEGNVIDLGVYQLQVVEACSGLRYLFPLMSFGFLINCLYKAPAWQKVILFLSTIPITILMNSFRIGFIGVTVDNWGIEMAEGFLHDFEGWVVFMACLAVLFAEMYVFHLFSKDGLRFDERLDIAMPDFSKGSFDVSSAIKSVNITAPLVALVMVLGFAMYFSSLGDRKIPDLERSSLADFPLYGSGWIGRESSFDEKTLEALDLTDYIIADFRNNTGGDIPVNFYVAWYASQTKGESIHSPRTCLPGGGWVFDQLEQVRVPLEGMTGPMVNRVVMTQGDAKQLVYYWFEGRGRTITNEYLAKWYIFVDALTRNRTDGALVRLVTFVPEGSDVADADARLRDFLQSFYADIADYVPE